MKAISNKKILSGINKALAHLLENDGNLLQRNLKEPLLSGLLSYYLKPIFKEYDVDVEYNGDVEKINDRKALDIAKSRIAKIGYRPNNDNNYKLSPDIIIHKRLTNDHNLVVIEVKKDVSSELAKKYDLIKLEHLTIDYLGNHYNYLLGIAIILGTGNNTGSIEKIYFKDGLPFSEESILNL